MICSLQIFDFFRTSLCRVTASDQYVHEGLNTPQARFHRIGNRVLHSAGVHRWNLERRQELTCGRTGTVAFSPVSWQIHSDVDRGRAFMDLSKWNEYTAGQRRSFMLAILAPTETHIRSIRIEAIVLRQQ
jgi:hypothetical protein